MYALSDHIRRKMSRRVMGRLRMTMACVELELSKTLDDEDGGERNAPGFQRLTGEDMQVVMVTLAVKRRMRRCGGLRSTEGRKEGAGGSEQSPVSFAPSAPSKTRMEDFTFSACIWGSESSSGAVDLLIVDLRVVLGQIRSWLMVVRPARRSLWS